MREQNRAAAQWRACCASDDALREQIDAQLSEGRLPAIQGGSGAVMVTASSATDGSSARRARARRGSLPLGRLSSEPLAPAKSGAYSRNRN